MTKKKGLYICVCVYECMYVCVYACMCICMNVLYESMYCKNVCIVLIYVLYESMYCMNLCIVWIYVFSTSTWYYCLYFRHGDPNRALLYLNKACSGEIEDEVMYILRSQCHMKLGHYHSADQVLYTFHKTSQEWFLLLIVT